MRTSKLAKAIGACAITGALFVGLANPAGAEERKQRQPTKNPPTQTYYCKKGGKRVQATSAAAASVACRGYGGLR